MTIHFQRASRIEAVSLDQQEVLFCPRTNKFTLLNPNARFVWGALANPCSAAQIAAALATGRVAADVEADVTRLLDAMMVRGLVQQVDPAPTPVLGAPPAIAWHVPALRDVSEDEVLAAFQMSAAEISAASCWWFSCSTGCP